MSTSFTSFVETTSAEILEAMISDYQARVPEWSPNDAAPEVITMSVIALRHAQLIERFGLVLDEIYIRSGTTIDKIPFLAATNASATATVTMTDEAIADGFSHTIPAGLQVDLPDGEGGTQSFAVVNDVVVPIGNPATATGEVLLLAVDAGTAGNDLSGPALQAGPVMDFIDTITLVAPTAGGEDAETVADYIDRLSIYRQRSSPKLVRSIDFQLAALDVPGVARCLALDLYDADTDTDDVPGHITLIPIDENGNAITGTVLDAVEAATQDPALNLLNLVVHIIAPTVTAFPVHFAAKSLAGYDPAVVELAAIAAVEAYLSKAQWGAFDPSGRPSWRESLLVRHGELYAVLNNVQGLDYVTTLTVNAVSDGDKSLTGPGALPNATVTGDVTAP